MLPLLSERGPVTDMYITGTGWITAGGTGRGNLDTPFIIKKGQLPQIQGDDLPVNPVFRKGRLDKFSLLGLKTISYALIDAGLYKWDNKRNIGIIASTVHGCLATDLDYNKTVIPENGTLPDPNLFTHTLSNIFLGYAAILFGLTGPNFILYEKTSAGISAIRSALETILSGECDIMLAGICDVELPENATGNEMVIPGSIFVVIEKSPTQGDEKYGRLSMDQKGNILLNRIVINDIASCLRECINVLHELQGHGVPCP
jgi:3-oxoacyl-[acyl-carrier-protein] synthase II